MKFKVDENLHESIAQLLVDAGHDADTVHSEGLRGSDDGLILAACRSEQRTLITFDQDFANLRAYPPSETAGLIVLRLHSQSRKHVLSVMSRVLQHLAIQTVDKKLWVVTESEIRIRES